jgi:hypothetical protein
MRHARNQVLKQLRYTRQPHGTPHFLIRRPVTIQLSGNVLVILPRKLFPASQVAAEVNTLIIAPIRRLSSSTSKFFRVACLEMEIQIILYIS